MTKEDQFQKMVRDFHYRISYFKPLAGTPTGSLSELEQKQVELRVSLIEEEANEFVDAVREENVIEAIDALCDLLYVTYGTADVFDICLDSEADAAMLPTIVSAVNWVELKRELRAFTISIEDAVKCLRVFQQFNAKERLKDRLYEIVRGCWRCASQALGVDLRPFFSEVHRTNMHKLTGPKREDGKQLKPPGWKPPRIKAMYERLLAGKDPTCPEDCRCPINCPHPEGGLACGTCGGLEVGTDS